MKESTPTAYDAQIKMVWMAADCESCRPILMILHRKLFIRSQKYRWQLRDYATARAKFGTNADASARSLPTNAFAFEWLAVRIYEEEQPSSTCVLFY